MQKIINKVITLFITLVIISPSFISTTVYASNNVKLNAQTNDNKIEEKSNNIIETKDVSNSIEQSTELKIEDNDNFKEESIELNINTPQEISEGYMYANLNRENKLDTVFNEIYSINIGSLNLADKIVIKEENPSILYTNTKKLNIKDDVETKRILVIKSEMNSILGEEGKVTVKDEDGNELGILTDKVLELEVNTNNVILETSKPIKEGTLHIKVDKAIKGIYSKEQMEFFERLIIKSSLKLYKEDEEIKKESKIKEIILKAPTSKATIEISPNNLSTIVENKDVVFNIVLHNKDITNALYKNPKFKIELPSQITKIEPTSAKILYDTEINTGRLSVENNTILIALEGTQTEYETVATTEGALIRIVANLTLDNLSPSSTEIIKLEYTNELTGETNVAETEANIVAPSGFVTTNTLNVDGKTVTTIESDVDDIKISKDTTSKEMEISATVVNNLGTEAEGVTILGRIPFEGNKTIEGKELGSTINTTMSKPISTQGLKNAKVYYSENGEEDINGKGWTTESNENTKSFKIVTEDNLADKSIASFSYSVNLPETLDYGNVAKETYGVLYSNNSTAGLKTNLAQAKAVGATTGNMPELNINVSAFDTNDGHAIIDGGTVTEGEYITYKITLSNTGNEDLTDVRLTTKLPDALSKINHTENYGIDKFDYYTKDSNKEIESAIETIKAQENTEIEIDTQVSQRISNITDEEEKKITLVLNGTASNLENDVTKTYTINNTEGSYSLKLRSDLEGKFYATKGQKINFVIDADKFNNKEFNNAKLKLKIPEGINYISNFSRIYNDQYEVTYQNNEVTIQLDNSRKSEIINFQTEVLSGNIKNATIIATISYDDGQDQVKSNKLILDTESIENSIQVTHKTNISTGTPSKTDIVEYYIDIKNIGNETRTIKFEDIIPEELSIIKYTMIVNGEVVHEIDEEYSIGYLTSYIDLKSGESARATIKAKIVTENYTSITNAPKIEVNSISIPVNKITLNLSDSGITSNENQQNDNNNNENNNDGNNDSYINHTANDIANGIYSINGVAWFDANSNGKKDDNEEKIKSVGMILINAGTGNIVKDSNGNELKTVTDENGNYSFSGLNKGSYIVIAVYDISQYTVGIYKIDNVLDIENSDFVSTRYNNEEVGATDVLELTSGNLYNIDFGLVDRNTFNLSLEKVVSKITVSNPKSKNRVYDYDKNFVKVELSNSNIDTTTVLVEYKIKVTNDGKLAGYANSIVDYLPKEMVFNSELNPNWYVGQDGNAYNTSLANTIINPGETKEITIILSKKMTSENVGTINNFAEIQSAYNKYGIVDANSIAGNKKQGEDDISSAEMTIAIGTGRDMIRITGMTVGILALIAVALFAIKKRVIDKY